MNLQEMQVNLYEELWAYLARQEEQIRTDYQIGLNMACSRWKRVVGRIRAVPVDILPDTTEQLQSNLEQLLEELSQYRYALTYAFLPVLKEAKYYFSQDQRMNYDYWKTK